MFGDELIGSMKRGAYLISTARAEITDRDAVVRALESGRLAGYAAGPREILEAWLDGAPVREEYLIVEGGALAGTGAHSYSTGK
ncbi:NAD(P)-dependent oxidoreductase [[Actinomadura] parvosata]|uniref:NAD(P)-dependent oxidoreductase n=1 Tax=[Actinomadura] parvosata TaxID=1955412 RepID=UPI00406C5C3F